MMDKDFHKRPTHPGENSESDTTDNLKIPDKIGPYKIESLLDKGGMSLLYLATHPETKEPTTIKVLSPRFAANTDVTKRFLEEAEIIAMADHPNIVKLYGHGHWEGGLYIAMEFIEGISLRQYLLRTPLSLKRALEITVDIAYALCHLHTHGVIHRDLKPENILVTESGAIKVIDFGIAQLLTEKDASSGESHQRLMGTPFYMSPEQRDTPDKVSYPSDIYSLGIITYELILGKLCHGRIHISLMPKGMQNILTKALQPKPQDRYQDVVDFIAAIADYMHSENFKNEYQPLDQLSEMTLSIKQAEQSLLPSATPEWPHFSVGVAQHKGIAIAGVYYDFFQHSGSRYSILCLEAEDKGVEGMLYTAVARGMIRSLLENGCPPENLIKQLNTLLVKDSIQQPYLFKHIVFDANNNHFQYLSTNDCPIWYVKNEHEKKPLRLKSTSPKVGLSQEANFNFEEHNWNEGDTLIFCSYRINSDDPTTDGNHVEDFLSKTLKEFLDFSPQQLTNSVTRRLRTAKEKIYQENTISLFAVRRG